MGLPACFAAVTPTESAAHRFVYTPRAAPGSLRLRDAILQHAPYLPQMPKGWHGSQSFPRQFRPFRQRRTLDPPDVAVAPQMLGLETLDSVACVFPMIAKR